MSQMVAWIEHRVAFYSIARRTSAGQPLASLLELQLGRNGNAQTIVQKLSWIKVS